MRANHNQRGFTLIELLVVVSIIGILFAVALPIFENTGAKNTNRAAMQVINTIRLARQHAIANRQMVLIVFPTRDGTGHADMQLHSYAVLAVTNGIVGTYQVPKKPDARDPTPADMKFEFLTGWETLPEGIYFDDDPTLTGNYVFGKGSNNKNAYNGEFKFPMDPAKPNNLSQVMAAIMFKPNGRAYTMCDANKNTKYWQDMDYSRIYVSSDKFYPITHGGDSLDTPTTIPGTNTVIRIRNKTGQVHIMDGAQ